MAIHVQVVVDLSWPCASWHYWTFFFLTWALEVWMPLSDTYKNIHDICSKFGSLVFTPETRLSAMVRAMILDIAGGYMAAMGENK